VVLECFHQCWDRLWVCDLLQSFGCGMLNQQIPLSSCEGHEKGLDRSSILQLAERLCGLPPGLRVF
jgi:hypothetical protein